MKDPVKSHFEGELSDLNDPSLLYAQHSRPASLSACQPVNQIWSDDFFYSVPKNAICWIQVALGGITTIIAAETAAQERGE